MNSFQFEASIHLFYLFPLFLTITKQKRRSKKPLMKFCISYGTYHKSSWQLLNIDGKERGVLLRISENEFSMPKNQS